MVEPSHIENMWMLNDVEAGGPGGFDTSSETCDLSSQCRKTRCLPQTDLGNLVPCYSSTRRGNCSKSSTFEERAWLSMCECCKVFFLSEVDSGEKAAD